ncbi:MAG: YegS/Rv2252/BmrU family lipid kinase [Bacteroidota bacterium]
MEIPPKWYIIINPVAGSGKSLKRWKKFKKLIDKANISYQYEVSSHKGACFEIVKNALKKDFKHFLAVGGDGTLNELINSLCRQSHPNELKEESALIVAQLAIGTGNDWLRSQKSKSENDEELIQKMSDPLRFCNRQDIGKITFRTSREPFFFINMLGVGFSGRVVENTVNHPALKKSGAVGYVLSLISSLGSFEEIKTKISFNRERLNKNLFQMSIGIGKYAGGGMMFCPKAVLDDGLFDLTIVKTISRFKVVANILSLFNGKFVSNKEVFLYKTSDLTFDFEKPVPLEADGEFLGYERTIEIASIDQKIKFLI